MKWKNVRVLFFLHLLLMLYSASGIFSKLAAGQPFLSPRFCLYMDRSTVFNHTRRIFTAMLPVAFGPEFEEKPKPPKGRIKPSPRKRTPQHRRAFFALLDDVSRIAYTYREQETAQEAPGDRQETASRAGEG